MTAPRLVHLSDLERLYDDPEAVGRLAGTIQELRDGRTLVVGSGDTTALGALSLSTDAGREQARPFYEAVSPDADTLGNHDLDLGPEWAMQWMRSTPGTHLLANASGFPGDDPAGSTILQVGKMRVGLIGVTHPETPAICTAAETLTFEDPVDVVSRETARLRERGADVVVVLSHCGTVDADIAAETTVDAVLGGHVHDHVTAVVDGTLLARTRGGQAGEYQVLTLGETLRVDHHLIDGAPLDEELAASYRDRHAAAGLDEAICQFPGPLTHAEAGRLVADAYRQAADAAIGIVLGPSVRTGLSAQVTVGDVLGLVPFESDLLALEVAGRDIEAIASALPTPIEDSPARVFAAGLSREADGTTTVDGRPIDPRATYRVATTGYLPYTELLPGITQDATATVVGPQHEIIVEAVRSGVVPAGSGRISRYP